MMHTAQGTSIRTGRQASCTEYEDYIGEEKEDDAEDESEDERQNYCHIVQTNKLIPVMQEKKSARTRRSFCEEIGRMDRQMVLQETVQHTTRKKAWKTFKLVDEDEYHHDSKFAKFMFEGLGIDELSIHFKVQPHALWFKFFKQQDLLLRRQ
jgi:hypothetical protein